MRARVLAYDGGHFLLTSPEMALIHPEQIAIARQSLRFAARACCEIFAADRGRSVLRIPLDERRRQIEAIPWVEQATVRRALPQSHRSGNRRAHAHRFLARGQRYGAGRRARRDPRPARSRAISIFRWSPASTRTCRWTTASSACSFSAGFTQQIESARAGRARSGERSGSLRRARFARHAHGFAGRWRRGPRPDSAMRRAWRRYRCAGAGAFRRRRFCRQVSDAVENIGAVARHGGTRRVGGPAVQPRSGGESGHSRLSRSVHATAAAEARGEASRRSRDAALAIR